MTHSVKCISDHAEDLADGRSLPPGELAHNVDIEDSHNKRLLDEGRILDLGSGKAPAREAAEAKAKELGISGNIGQMKDDTLATKIAEAEDKKGGGNA